MTGHHGPIARLLRDAAVALALLAASAGAMGAPVLPTWLAPDAQVARAEPKVQPALPAATAPVARASLERALHVAVPASAKSLRMPDVESLPSSAPVQVGFAREL